MLVMDGNEVLKLNKNLQKIDYNNPHQLVANNFEILTRLKHHKNLKAIPHTALMKNPLDKRIKKNFYKK